MIPLSKSPYLTKLTLSNETNKKRKLPPLKTSNDENIFGTLKAQDFSALDGSNKKLRNVRKIKSFADDVEKDRFRENPFEGTFYPSDLSLEQFKCACERCFEDYKKIHARRERSTL